MTKFWLMVFTLAAIPIAHAGPVALRELVAGDEDVLRQRVPYLFGAKPGYADLDEAIRVLMERGTYENVFVERQGEVLSITGKPIRTVEAIVLGGLSKTSDGELRPLLDIKAGDRFDRKRAVAAGQKIKTYLGEHGFFNAVVEIEFQKMPSRNMKISFAITEHEPCVIAKLDFETPNVDLKTKLRARFGRLRKKTLTTDRVRTLITEMNGFLTDERYLAAEVTGPAVTYDGPKTEAYLRFDIREPTRWEFYPRGFKFKTITDVYQALDVSNHERKNVDPAGEGAERIRQSYLEAGFPSVAIETKVTTPPNTFLRRVHYLITEGPRARIAAIEVAGRISRPARYYSEFVLENSSDLVGKGYYNRADLDNGYKNLTTALRNQGYLRARVQATRTEFNPKRDQVTMHLLLEEGPQTQIRALDFSGNRFFSSFELAQVTGLETNTPLHLNDFEASLEKLKTFYHNQGFLEMRLLNEGEEMIQYDGKGTQARVLFSVFEGPRIRVNSIVVEGNSFTKTYVILKEANFKLGELLTPEKLDNATARLNRLGLFSRVEINTLEENTTVAQRTLIISITERDPGVFRLGMGVTNERNLSVRGFTGLGYNNLFGTARAVSGRVVVKENVGQINFPETEIAAGYLEPFLFNTRTRGRVNLTRSERIFEYEPTSSLKTYITTTNRLDLLAERDLSLHTKLTFKVYTLESNREWERYGRCIPTDDSPFDSTRYCAPNIQQIATVGPTLDVDYRDNPFLPTRGSFTRFVTDYSDPAFGSSRGVNFARYEANYTYYYRLGSPRWVWANSARGGYVRNLSDEVGSGVPTTYAFLLGSIYTIRGFDLTTDNERIPKQNDGGFVVTRRNQKLIKTDSYYYLIKSELRFPLYLDHGGVIFYDGAEVGVSGFHFKRPYRQSVGVGYRYNTPVGPLALDFAFKIDPDRTPGYREQIMRFHLSIGTF